MTDTSTLKDTTMKDRLLVLAGLAAFGALIATTKPVSSAMVIRFANTISLVHNIYVTLAPSKAATLYGLESSPMRNWVLERCGMINLTTAVTAWMLFGRSADVVTAVGMGAFVTAIVMTKAVLNEEWKQFGGKGLPHILLTVFSVGTAFYCLFAYDANHADVDANYNDELRDLFVAMFIIARLVHGFVFAVFPEKSSKSYGGLDVAPIVHEIQMMGTFALANGIFMAGVYLDKVPLSNEQVFGWSYVPMLVSGVLHEFVLERGSGGGDPNPKYLWMLLQLLVVGTLLVKY